MVDSEGKGGSRSMKIGLVISTNEPELAWNAFRYGVKALENKHQVKAFLLGRGVECEGINDTKFEVGKMMNEFVGKGGTILACGTCLKIRKKRGSKLCPMGSMQDLVDLTVQSDRVLTFG